MKLEQQTEVKERLTIDLLYQKENPKDVTLQIWWGRLRLTAPVQASLPN
jgi:hypothetical protein